MSEPRYRYRIPPCADYDIPAMESWLEDMAAKGLHLAQDGFFMGLAHFEDGAPRKERFRLEPTATQKGILSNEYDPDCDVVDMNLQMGWHYRARRGQFHIYSCADPHAPELHTDPQVQAITMAALGKYQRKSLMSTLVLFVIYDLFHFGDMIVSSAVTFGIWRMLLFAGLMAWDLLRQVRTVVTISRFRRQLQSGEALPHRSDYHRRRMGYLIAGGIRKLLWVVLVVSLLFSIGANIAEEDKMELDSYTDPLPFATLADLYPGAEIRRIDGFLHSEITVWEDFISPENYEFSEYAEVTYEGQTFDCYLSVQYHRTRWDWVARILSNELVSQVGANPLEQSLTKLFGDEPVVLTELVLPDADYCAYYYRFRGQPWLVIQCNEVVLRANLDVLGTGVQIDVEDLAQILISHIR